MKTLFVLTTNNNDKLLLSLFLLLVLNPNLLELLSYPLRKRTMSFQSRSKMDLVRKLLQHLVSPIQLINLFPNNSNRKNDDSPSIETKTFLLRIAPFLPLPMS